MNDNSLLPAFHFNISFKELPDDNGNDHSFMSISGLKTYVVPPVDDNKRPRKKLTTQFGPLILKRAVSTDQQSALRKWVLKNLAKPRKKLLPELLIEVLNEEHIPQMTFKVEHISAIGWELGELHAGKSELLMEEISLQYKSLTII